MSNQANTAGGSSVPNYCEQYYRLVKACRIADYLQAAGISSSMAQMAVEADRALAGEAVGVDLPSVETWAVVIKLLVDRENATGALKLRGERK